MACQIFIAESRKRCAREKSNLLSPPPAAEKLAGGEVCVCAWEQLWHLHRHLASVVVYRRVGCPACLTYGSFEIKCALLLSPFSTRGGGGGLGASFKGDIQAWENGGKFLQPGIFIRGGGLYYYKGRGESKSWKCN